MGRIVATLLYPPTTKRHYDVIAKENRVRQEAFDTFEPYDFLSLDNCIRRVRKNFDGLIYGV